MRLAGFANTEVPIFPLSYENFGSRFVQEGTLRRARFQTKFISGEAKILRASSYLLPSGASSIAPARAKASIAVFQEPPSRFSILNQFPWMVFSLTVSE